MAYCYECGSEVAQIDVFCPYCGISLKPVAIAGDNNDDFSSQAEDFSAPQVESETNEIKVETDSEIFTESADEAVEKSHEESAFATAETEENLDLNNEPEQIESPKIASELDSSEFALTEPERHSEEISPQTETKLDDFSDIPTPAMIENFESFTAVSSKREEPEDFELKKISANEESTSEDYLEDYSLDTSETDSVLESEAIDKQVEAENPFEFKENVSSNVEKESPETTSTFEETPNKIAAEETSASEQNFDSFSETVPYIAPLQKDSVNSETNLPEKAEDFENEPEIIATVVEPIEKPSEDLESFDPNSASSVFDSVQIMEDKNLTDNQPQIESENIVTSVVSSEIAAKENVVPETTAEEINISHTSPIVSGSDTDGKKAAKLKPLDEGIILNNRYEIIRKIGGGGMGAVYLASDNNLGGVLRAVKEMVQSYIEEEQQEKSVNDFRRESMILSTLEHNSIPTIYDYFYDDKESRFYLVMKYINGGDLSGRLRAAPEGKIDEKTVTEWSIQIADVLDYLHNRPTTIVYRDLKPANVMIDGNSGRVMLIDFGIARSINKEEKGVTAVGTMGYAPPELFSGNVEPRSDIYSLGSTMFHLLTGADPQSNPLLIFDFQKNPRPRQINSLLSDQIERILMRAVEYNSTARFGSAIEFKKVLEEHLENLKAGRVTYGIKEVPASVSLENQIVFCGFCGQKIVASDMFCAFCGSKQPLSQHGVHAEIYSNAPQTAKLMILGTNELESPVFTLDKEDNIVGRRDPQSGIFPEVDLSKFDPQTKISRRHARIWRDSGNFMVEDLGSSNGTVVMPSVSDVVRLLPHQPHILASGDKIRIGDTTLHFVKG